MYISAGLAILSVLLNNALQASQEFDLSCGNTRLLIKENPHRQIYSSIMASTVKNLVLILGLSLTHVLALPHVAQTDTATILAASPTTPINTTKTLSFPLAARTDNYGSWCNADVGDGLAGNYFITLKGWGGAPSEHCGQGLLDNLHGHCGDVDDWSCEKVGSLGNGALISFYLSGPKYAHCLNDAIWQASPPDKRETGFCCTWDVFPGCH